MRPTLVTGANGHVGNNLCRLLVARGEPVRAMIRPSADPAPLAGLDLEIVRGDIVDPASTGRALEGCGRLYHSAAGFLMWSRAPERDIIRPSVEGTRNVLEAAARAGVEKVLYTSTSGTMGLPTRPDQPFDETHFNTEPHTHYLRGKIAAEKEAFAIAGRTGLPVTSIHPGFVLGPRFWKPSESVHQVEQFLNHGSPIYFDGGFGVVDVEDVARGAILAMDKGRTGERYLLSGENVTVKGLFDLMAEATGLPAPRVKLPVGVLRAVVAAELPQLAEPADRAGHGARLRDEALPHGRREARVAEPAQARGRGRVEAAPELELAARARLEAPEPVRDAVLDARVVADVEVEVAERALGAPVAAVERVALGDVEGAGNHLAVLARDHEHEARAQALARQREEALVQVLLPPGELVDRAAVEREHAREERVGDAVADVGHDLDALGGELAALAAHLVAPLAAQAHEVVGEGREARVRPVVLPAGAGEPAARLERRRLVGETEVDVCGREVVLVAHVLDGRGERRDDLAAVGARRGEEARAGHRREGDRDQELRVIVDALAGRGGGPVLVEDELAQAKPLHVERAGPDQALALPERQEARQPAGRGGGGARVLEDREPLPLEEGRAVTDQRVPRRVRDVAHRFEEAEGLHTIGLRAGDGRALPASRRSIAPATRAGARARQRGRGGAAARRPPPRGARRWRARRRGPGGARAPSRPSARRRRTRRCCAGPCPSRAPAAGAPSSPPPGRRRAR